MKDEHTPLVNKEEGKKEGKEYHKNAVLSCDRERETKTARRERERGRRTYIQEPGASPGPPFSENSAQKQLY